MTCGIRPFLVSWTEDCNSMLGDAWGGSGGLRMHGRAKDFLVSRGAKLGGALPLIFCMHVRSGPIYWGDYLPCIKDYKVMVFYM